MCERERLRERERERRDGRGEREVGATEEKKEGKTKRNCSYLFLQ